MHVDDDGDRTKGFIDGNVTGDDYSYDANGNMTVDKNKGIAAITYNHLNLPDKVTKNTGEYIKYSYDATGRKLSQQVYDASNTLKKKSDYAGEYFYENDTLKFINHEEGRVVMIDQGQPTKEYQYHLKDHLGNVRTTFTTKEETEEAKATLETATAATEQSQFLRYDNARKIQSPLFDHTNGTATGYAERLNGSANEIYGIARSISVMPGDKINAEVYAKYVDTNSSNWTSALNTLLTQIANGTSTAGTVIDGAGYSSSTSSFSLGGLIDKSNDNSTGPKAYLNWLVFDRDYVLLNGGFKKMSDAAKEYGQDVAHEYLASPDITITQPGYVYIYLSNEEGTPVEVYFDDFKVTHTKSPVVQQDEYFAFGLTFNGYQRENSLPQNLKYNGKEMQDELSIGVYDYGWRMYDPSIARWNRIDPFADKFVSLNPYNYVANNPLIFFDPDGRIIEGDTKRVSELKDKGKSIISAEGKRQARLNSKIAARSAEGKSTTRQERRLENSKERVNQVEGTLGEISKMEASETIYHVNSEYEDQPDGTSGETSYDNGKVMINVSRNYGLHGLAHELKHAYQFEIGQLDFYGTTGKPGLLYDISDEVAAFKRQFAFNSSSVGRVGGFSGIDSHFVSQINKVYSSMPQSNLNVNSSLILMQTSYSQAGKYQNFVDTNNLHKTYKDANYEAFIHK